MLSRWTDFLTADGEKECRDRDSEFIDDFDSRAEILQRWEEGWACLFNSLEWLSPSDLSSEVKIRGESLTIYDAVHRQLDHYGYHIGQVVMIARTRIGDGDWETLSIARGDSKRFNGTHWKE